MYFFHSNCNSYILALNYIAKLFNLPSDVIRCHDAHLKVYEEIMQHIVLIYKICIKTFKFESFLLKHLSTDAVY